MYIRGNVILWARRDSYC